MSEIHKLWKQHWDASFPDGLRDLEIDGVDLTLLDADIAGCISTFVERGNLNLFQTAALGLCYKNAFSVSSRLNKEGSEYFSRLERLAELVLIEVARKNRPEHYKS